MRKTMKHLRISGPNLDSKQNLPNKIRNFIHYTDTALLFLSLYNNTFSVTQVIQSWMGQGLSRLWNDVVMNYLYHNLIKDRGSAGNPWTKHMFCVSWIDPGTSQIRNMNYYNFTTTTCGGKLLCHANRNISLYYVRFILILSSIYFTLYIQACV
jgi:hypothetical protein